MLESIASRLRRLIHEQRGVALTEFALIAPLLFVVLFATIDFGKAINYWNAETQMAAQGARLAAINGSNACNNGVAACVGTCLDGSTPPSNLADYIQCQADTNDLRNGGGSATKANVCITPSGGGAPGQPVVVSVTTHYTWLPLYSLIHLHLAPITISGQATMRLERGWSDPTPVHSTGGTCP